MYSVKEVEAHMKHEDNLRKEHPTHDWEFDWSSSTSTICNAVCKKCGATAQVRYLGDVYFQDNWAVLTTSGRSITLATTLRGYDCDAMSMEAALQ